MLELIKPPYLIYELHKEDLHNLHSIPSVFRTGVTGRQKQVKLSHYRPLRFQEVEVARIPRQSAHEGEKIVSTTHRPPLPLVDIPDTHFG